MDHLTTHLFRPTPHNPIDSSMQYIRARRRPRPVAVTRSRPRPCV